MANRKPLACSDGLLDGDSLGLEAIIRWPSAGARRWLQETLPRLRSDSRAAALVAVGSSVREVDSSADLDLILLYDGQKPDFSTPPVDVDLRAYPLADVERLIVDQGEDLLGWAVQFGRIVCEREGVWSNIAKRVKPQVPMPSSVTALERARGARIIVQDLVKVGDEDAAREQFVTMLTHLARAALIQAGVYPKSRPELPDQLRGIKQSKLAMQLGHALDPRRSVPDLLSEIAAAF